MFGQPPAQIPPCFGLDLGKFEVKEEWSVKTGVDTQRQDRCGKCPLVIQCALITIVEKMR